MIRRIWTKQEDDIMREKFADTQTIELCKILDRSYGSVSGRSYLYIVTKD